MKRVGFVSIILVGLFAGCRAVGPDYRAPETPQPVAALLQAETGAAIAPDETAVWWNVFGDPALTNLIRMALSGNRSLRGSLAKVREARARLRISRAGLLPQVDVQGAYKRFHNSENTLSSYDGSDYLTGFDASWELDLAGRRRRALEASRADFEAECATLQNAWVSLAAETARTYVDLQTVRQRLAVAQTNLLLQTETLGLVTSRARAGISDELAVEQARYNVEQTRASIPGLEADEAAALNALAVLTGVMPGELEATAAAPAPIPSAAPRVLAGIPADLLRRRPDVRAAERSLAAQTARIGEARADLYPTFRLTGSVGLESLEGNSFFEYGSRFFGLSPSLSWPVFRAGSIRANIEVQNALQEKALADYEQTVLAAVAELRDGLTAYGRAYVQKDALTKAAAAARAAVEIAQNRYANGIADFNSVLDAQRSLLSFEQSLKICEGTIASDLIRVYKALGGGWSALSDKTGEPSHDEIVPLLVN